MPALSQARIAENFNASRNDFVFRDMLKNYLNQNCNMNEHKFVYILKTMYKNMKLYNSIYFKKYQREIKLHFKPCLTLIKYFAFPASLPKTSKNKLFLENFVFGLFRTIFFKSFKASFKFRFPFAMTFSSGSLFLEIFSVYRGFILQIYIDFFSGGSR